jgi:FkbM family methyltransferase
VKALRNKLVDTLIARLPRSVRTALKKLLFDLRQRRFTPYLTKKNLDGVSFDFWIGDTDARAWYDRTDRLSLEMTFVRDRMIEPGDVVLYCGAHHGRTVILFSHWVGKNGRVIAFEASPTNCDVLARNIAINGITNVTIERKAVGASHGRVRIDGVSDSTVIFSKQGTEVEITCLDDYANLKPAFIKVDVEGFEYEVLRGARSILSKRPKLAVEIHGDKLAKYGTSLDAILDAIGRDRYTFWVQWDDREEPRPYDCSQPIMQRAHLYCLPVRDQSA